MNLSATFPLLSNINLLPLILFVDFVTIKYILFQIRPFRQAHFNREKDRELLRLSKYLKDIASLDDFTCLNHKKWEK